MRAARANRQWPAARTATRPTEGCPFVLGWGYCGYLLTGLGALPSTRDSPARSSHRPATPTLEPQVESILAKPNYRHQKKQKEQARKLRQAEKQSRRLAARAGAEIATAAESSADATTQAVAPNPAQAGT